MPSVAETLVCVSCKAAIPAGDWNRFDSTCPFCHKHRSALVFPQLFSAEKRSTAGELVMEAGEASCFYHSQKRAAVPCDQCGRFLCSLCQVEFMGQNWCPGCIENRKQKGQLSDLDTGRPLYDNMALSLATVPVILMVWPTIFTAPMAIYMSLRYWRAPSSIRPRTKARFVVALVLGAAQIIAWIWLIAYAVYRR